MSFSKNTVIVIPSHQPLEPIFQELLPPGIPVIIVNSSQRSITCNHPHTTVYNPPDYKRILGKKRYQGFTPFEGAAACRVFGHLMAWKAGYKNIIMLDNDCFPKKQFLQEHLSALDTSKAPVIKSSSGWINPISQTGWYSRGFPYELRHPAKLTHTSKAVNIVFNMGLWENVIDINGIDKVITPPPKHIKLKQQVTVASGMIPISGMNNIIIADVIPAFVLIPNITIGQWTISRHDDVWGGYILKSLIDKKGDHLSYGSPIIYHTKESYQPQVLAHEHYLHLMNHMFYTLVDLSLESVKVSTYPNMMLNFSESFASTLSKEKRNMPPHYYQAFTKVSESLSWWSQQFLEP